MYKLDSKFPMEQSRLVPGQGAGGLPEDQRRHMIEEAAYFRAEHRGFAGGDPLQDWLAAEREIEQQLADDQPHRADEEGLQARLRDEVRKAFARLPDRVDASALKVAFARAMDEARQLEGASAEAVQRAAHNLRQELSRATESMGPTWEHFSERSAGLFSVWKGRSRDFVGRAGDSVRHWLHREHQGREH